MEAKNIWGKIQNMASRIFTAGNVKKAGGFLIVCAILAGGGAWYHHQQEQAKDNQLRQARTTMIAAQAAQNNLSLLDMDTVRALAAQAIGIEESNITYREISLIDAAAKRVEKEHDKYKQEKKQLYYAQASANTINAQQIPSFQPLYKVSCKANNIKYKLKIDAVTGQVLHSEID